MAEKIQCPDCLGTGQGAPCSDPDCVSGEVRCPNCYDSNPGYEDCWDCNGTGEIECSDCYGSGVIYVDEYEEDCGQCNGSGYLLCSVCGGTGSLPCSVCNGNYSYVCGECGGDGFLDCETCSGTGEIESSIGYSITFEENGGTSVNDLTEQTNLPNPLPTPTKSGYTFLGWYYDSTFTTKAQANDVLTANVTLYAKWYTPYEPKIFEVGDVLPQRRITIYRDSSTDSPNISIKSDSDTFNFIYYSSPSWYYINGKRTFISGTRSTIVNLSSLSVEKRTISSVSDNIFSWEDTFVNYKNLEKTDIFPPSIIRFRLFGSSYFTTNGYELYTDGGSFTLATGGEDEDTYINGVKLNYNSFVDVDMRNWSLSKRTIAYTSYLGPESDSIGQWSSFSWEELPPSYSITFEENGGTSVNDLTEQTNLPNPLPTPTKSGYTFLGWYYDSDFTNEAHADDPLTGDITLYAKWEEISLGYTITFDSNGGSIVPQTSNATQLPNPLPPTTKPGYTFGGWYYESNFQTRAKAGDTIEANTTLYAKWLTLAQVLEHINNVVEELRSAIINKGGDAEGKLLIDFATIINSLKTYEVVETLAELELLEPTLNRVVFVVEGSGELAMGAPVKVTQDGDTLIIG